MPLEESPSFPSEDQNPQDQYNKFDPSENLDEQFFDHENNLKNELPGNNLNMQISNAFVPNENIEMFEINLTKIEKYKAKENQ